jgi:hypothetical protein
MIRITPRRLGLFAAALIGVGSLGLSMVKKLNLQQMITETDNAIVGEITDRNVTCIEGPELYFTHLTIKGRSLVDGSDTTVVVTYAGGFLDDEHGVWNSEAPSDENTKLGNEVVVFYKHVEDLGGGQEANAVYAAHAGLYRTIEGRKGTVVLGHGSGCAVPSNIALDTLDKQITTIRKAQDKDQ